MSICRSANRNWAEVQGNVILQLQGKWNLLRCFSLLLSEVFWGDSQRENGTVMQLSSDRANIYCFEAASMSLWLGCLFWRPLSFGFGLATESPLYYWLVYCYGADKNVWVGYKFQGASHGPTARFYVLCGVIHFLSVRMWKTSLYKIENHLCLRTWAIFSIPRCHLRHLVIFNVIFYTKKNAFVTSRKIIDKKKNILMVSQKHHEWQWGFD